MQYGRRGSVAQDLFRHQRAGVDHHIGPAEGAVAFERQQIGVARPGPDEHAPFPGDASPAGLERGQPGQGEGHALWGQAEKQRPASRRADARAPAASSAAGSATPGVPTHRATTSRRVRRPATRGQLLGAVERPSASRAAGRPRTMACSSAFRSTLATVAMLARRSGARRGSDPRPSSSASTKRRARSRRPAPGSSADTKDASSSIPPASSTRRSVIQRTVGRTAAPAVLPASRTNVTLAGSSVSSNQPPGEPTPE